MNRLALHRYLESAASSPQVLGRCDCVTFAVDVLRIGWGRDLSGSLGYSDRRSAVQRLRDAGGLEDAVTEVLGEPVPGDELVPGDFVFFPMRGQRTIGVLLDGFVVVRGHRTIHRVHVPRNAIGWRTDGR